MAAICTSRPATSDAVNTFTRDPATGALTFSGCLTGDTDTVGCTPIAGATAGGVNNGVDAPFSIAVSADGKSLYTANLAADSLVALHARPGDRSARLRRVRQLRHGPEHQVHLDAGQRCRWR